MWELLGFEEERETFGVLETKTAAGWIVKWFFSKRPALGTVCVLREG